MFVLFTNGKAEIRYDTTRRHDETTNKQQTTKQPNKNEVGVEWM